MINKEGWKKEYEEGKTFECPCCGHDNHEHSCRECHKDASREICWKNDGYCDECFNFIHNEIPKIEAEKGRLGVKCKCVDESCAKCLNVNCQDDNCPVHTKERKAKWRK